MVNYGGHNLAQVASQTVDLSLLQGHKDLSGPISAEWIERNIKVDRYVAFGSDAYFDLAEDAAARPLLQSGANVIFAYQGQVIAIQDSSGLPDDDGLSVGQTK